MEKKNCMTREDYTNIIEYALEILTFEDNITWHRLYYCTAWTATVDHYIFLKSYNTVVAIYNIKTGVLFDILRVQYGYTSTSSQHISKFRHMLDVKKTVRIDYIIED